MLTLPADAIDEATELARRRQPAAVEEQPQQDDAQPMDTTDEVVVELAVPRSTPHTVKQLRQLLKDHQLATHGSKAELARRAQEAGLVVVAADDDDGGVTLAD